MPDAVNEAAVALSEAALRARREFPAPKGALWVFGYGSLMWAPEFAHDRTCSALLRGYHRAFCIYSVQHRGTYEQPGLVLGLARGGACRGLAYRVPANEVAGALDTLWIREMPRDAYVPRLLRIEIGRKAVRALAFIANPAHAHYAGDLSHERAAEVIARCSGIRGPNLEYLRNTVEHLAALGVRDRGLARLHQRVMQLKAVRRRW